MRYLMSIINYELQQLFYYFEMINVVMNVFELSDIGLCNVLYQLMFWNLDF